MDGWEVELGYLLQITLSWVAFMPNYCLATVEIPAIVEKSYNVVMCGVISVGLIFTFY